MAAVTIDLAEDLLQRANSYVKSSGYASLSVLVADLISEKLSQTSPDALATQTMQKFEELGYIDAGLDI